MAIIFTGEVENTLVEQSRKEGMTPEQLLWKMLEQRQSACTESAELAEAGMSDYLSNLEDYEEKLARGEIKWL